VVERLIKGDHSDVLDVIQSYLSTERQAKGIRYSTWIAAELPDPTPVRIIEKSKAIPWLQ